MRRSCFALETTTKNSVIIIIARERKRREESRKEEGRGGRGGEQGTHLRLVLALDRRARREAEAARPHRPPRLVKLAEEGGTVGGGDLGGEEDAVLPRPSYTAPVPAWR